MRTGGRWSPIARGNPEGRLKTDRSGRRQADLEPGPTARAVGGLDRPAVALDDPRRDRQAEPGPGSVLARCAPEAVEHARQVLGAETGTGVLDAQARRGLI